MIVSHEHRYVFVEVPHTGTMAISQALRDSYGGEFVLRKHATYADFLRAATPDQRDYFAFAGVRNPLDLAVSRYFRFKNKERPIMGDPAWIARHGSVAQRMDQRVIDWIKRTDADFEAFLLRWYRLPYDSWSSLDQKRYDTVMRFESLQADFDETLHRIGIEPVGPLPSTNVTPGRERNWLQYYTPRARKRAIWVFGPFMEQWGYSFPSEWGDVRVPLLEQAAFPRRPALSVDLLALPALPRSAPARSVERVALQIAHGAHGLAQRELEPALVEPADVLLPARRRTRIETLLARLETL